MPQPHSENPAEENEEAHRTTGLTFRPLGASVIANQSVFSSEYGLQTTNPLEAPMATQDLRDGPSTTETSKYAEKGTHQVIQEGNSLPIRSPVPYRPFNTIDSWELTDDPVQLLKVQPNLSVSCLREQSQLKDSDPTPSTFRSPATDSDILMNSSFGDLVSFAPLSPSVLAAIVSAHPGTNSAHNDVNLTDSSDSFDSELTFAESLYTSVTSISTASSGSPLSTTFTVTVPNASPAPSSVLSGDYIIPNAFSSSPDLTRIKAASPLPPSSPPVSSSPAPLFSELSQPSSQTSQPNSSSSQPHKEEQKHVQDGVVTLIQPDMSFESNQLADNTRTDQSGSERTTSLSYAFLEPDISSTGMDIDPSDGQGSSLIESEEKIKSELVVQFETPAIWQPTKENTDFERNKSSDVREQASTQTVIQDLSEGLKQAPKRKANDKDLNDAAAKRPTIVPVIYRPTSSMRQKEQEKLLKPFRSPVIDPARAASSRQPAVSLPDPPVIKSKPQKADEPTVIEDARAKHRTARASAQFKSPLASSSPRTSSTVRLTPTIQALEGQIQTLKRAIKVKEQNEEVELKELIIKWREVGQEVAYEMWNLTRENASQTASASWGWNEGQEDKRKFGDGWGWGVQEGEKHCPEEERYRVVDEDTEMEGQPQETMGTMLRQLGIAPETLHWDEMAESFV